MLWRCWTCWASRQVFDSLPGYPATEDDLKKAYPVIKETFGTVDVIKRDFSKLLELWSEGRPDSLEYPASSVRSFSFADTVVAYTQFRDDPASVFGVLGLIATCAVTFLRCLARSVPIRGGIEADWAGEFEGETAHIYGPALIRAYVLESKDAKWPRVVAGEKLVSYLQQIAGNAESNEDVRIRAQSCIGCLATDIADGLHIVNCLSPGFRSLLAGSGLDMRDEAKKALAFLDSEQTRFRDRGNPKLAARYALAMAHFVAALQVPGT